MRADWPELRNYRLEVEIFQLGAKIAPLKMHRPHRVAFGVNIPSDNFDGVVIANG